MGLGFRRVATTTSGRGACGARIVRGHTRVYMEDLDPKPALLYTEMEWCEGAMEDAAGFRCGHLLTAIASVGFLRSCNGGGSHMHRVAGDKGIDSLQKHSVNDSRILVATIFYTNGSIYCVIASLQFRQAVNLSSLMGKNI
ncbi:uncharacterized protein LOC110433530 isoform X2 [Sorghum bicolor]|uniref:uncharacterized protein LOC110433530 isoform X2 n=1 Tax=Sorghum bicolor TaxID=4558 RepID=UPI000B4265A9|nr:uncharacterized protein LOC110433530 isoform X2 [Sorghum bicolor]|eukprot:XP_021311528.1 uncharacterized protein LOC110433530 isoform X2 [Sorghum bicolor]